MNGKEHNISRSFLGQSILGVVANLRKIVVFCFIVALATATWMMLVEQRWEASAIAMVPGARTASLGGLSGIGMAGISAAGLDDLAAQFSGLAGTSAETDISVVQQVLSSRTVMERVILEYGLIRRYKSVSMERALKKLGERVSVLLSPEGFFVVSAQGSTREEAAAMVMDLIGYANEELALLVTSRARRGRIEAEISLAEAADSLESAQARMEAFRALSGMSFPEEQGAGAIEVFQIIETELMLAEAELAGYAGGVSSRSPAYLQALQKIEYLRGVLENRLSTGDSLSAFPGMSMLPSYIREYESLFLELETRRAIYILIRQELEMLRLDEVKESPTLEILVPPSPEFLRVYPKRARTLIIFTLTAFMLSMLWIAVLTYFGRLMSSEGTGRFLREVISGTRKQLFPGRRNRKTGTGSS